ncbi:hypothetical protein NDU88_004780 [Pleurodeles waltl]|uniref:Secreted protein n=1 Tax=Pleurodeles waltl TaxID=8319 RepID=A0AAV7L2Y2_PLEWA|nr:hypothetical protein NDU88_004780 [Pleurodeles waltl]
MQALCTPNFAALPAILAAVSDNVAASVGVVWTCVTRMCAGRGTPAETAPNLGSQSRLGLLASEHFNVTVAGRRSKDTYSVVECYRLPGGACGKTRQRTVIDLFVPLKSRRDLLAICCVIGGGLGTLNGGRDRSYCTSCWEAFVPGGPRQ